MLKILIMGLGAFFVMQVHAFSCYLTVAKDNCWKDYNVTIGVFDTSNDKQIATLIIPEGSAWARQAFTCQPGEKLRFQAQFTPVFWESDQGKVYPAKDFWTLPDKPAQGDIAWNITLCYPEQFSEVPFPPQAGAHCKCDLSGIPPIKP